MIQISIFGKNFYFCPKFIFWPIFEFLIKISILGQNFYFGSKFLFWVKISILGQNLYFFPKVIFWPTFEFLTKNSIFHQQIYVFDQNLFFEQNFDFSPNFDFYQKFDFDWNFGFWSIFVANFSIFSKMFFLYIFLSNMEIDGKEVKIISNTSYFWKKRKKSISFDEKKSSI